MVKGNDRTKKLVSMIGIVIVLLCICITVDYADNVTITNMNDSAEPNLTESELLNDTHYVLPQGSGIAKLKNEGKLYTDKSEIPTISIWAKPSCNCRYKYKWYKKTFVNYCPYCKRYGVLTNLHKYPARFEQEISCRRCKADFCGVCGKEKYSWSHHYLQKIGEG